MQSNTISRFLRRPDVEKITGLSKSTIYAKMANGEFPAQIKLGPRLVVWAEAHVQEWMSAQMQVA